MKEIKKIIFGAAAPILVTLPGIVLSSCGTKTQDIEPTIIKCENIQTRINQKVELNKDFIIECNPETGFFIDQVFITIGTKMLVENTDFNVDKVNNKITVFGTSVNSTKITIIVTASDYNPEIFKNDVSFYALSNSTIKYTQPITNNSKVYISSDSGKTFTLLRDKDTISVDAGQKVILYGDNRNGLTTSDTNQIKITIEGSTILYGNIMSLIYGHNCETLQDIIPCEYCFYGLFSGSTGIWSVTEGFLPATQLTSHCYEALFSNCSCLLNAPQLPAKDLTDADYCYANMFSKCTRLLTAPDLPASKLSDCCYSWMFGYCSSLAEVNRNLLSAADEMQFASYSNMFDHCISLQVPPLLPATRLAESCYYYMFNGSGIKTLSDFTLSSTTLADKCYEGMFRGTKIETLTNFVLPAKKLKSYCYASMFEGIHIASLALHTPLFPQENINTAPYCWTHMFKDCDDLMEINPNFFANVSHMATAACLEMFSGCNNLTNIPYLPATTISSCAYQAMFADCFSIASFPNNWELPAETVNESGYYLMFSNCYNLKSELQTEMIKAKKVLTDGCASMFSGCNSLRTASDFKLAATTIDQGSYQGMFENCSSITNVEIMVTKIAEPLVINFALASMFVGCTSLKQVRVHFTDWEVDCSATYNWMEGAKNTNECKFICPQALSSKITTRGPDTVLSEWIIENQD